MFGLPSTGVIACFSAMRIIEEEKAFRKQCDLLHKKEANRLIKIREEMRNEEKEHRKALEIANAGRARNFWGD